MTKKKRRLTDKSAPQELPFDSLPDRRIMERMMRQLAADLGDEQPDGKPLDRAQDLMSQAFEASPTEQVKLAKRALKMSPDCADAHVLLAEHARTAEEALAHYSQGVAAGERALGKKAFREDVGHFWGVLETRPYMRARQGLAQCLWEAGRHEEAADHYRDMIRLTPNDNQGVRYSLATLLLDLEQNDELQQLLTQYKDDSLADWSYTKVLLAFRRGGESAQTAKLLKQAVKSNKHVPSYLLGTKQLPRDLPPYITMGGDDEAAAYVSGNRRAWLNTPGAISWVRKTLGIRMPKPPKPRRPSWPQLRLALRGLPLERGEVWQVDVIPMSADAQSMSGEDTSWLIVVVSRASQEMLGFDVSEAEPKPGDVWDFLTDTLRKPLQAEPHRPAKIEVCRKAFHTAWKTKLKQIDVECALVETLDSVDHVRSHMPSIQAESAVGMQDAAAAPEEILSLPSEPGEVWQIDLRPMPIWITGEGEPYRPWTALVVSQTDDLVLAHKAASDPPAAEWLWQAIIQAARQPVVGEPHRPGTIEVGSHEHREALEPLLDRAGIECRVSDRLETIDSAFDSLAQHMAGQGGPPAIVDAPGIMPAQMGSFFAAAADFYVQKPWQQVLSDTIIKVECDKVQSGPWCAVVMGQSGVQQGLAIYEDLVALQAVIVGDASDEENARGMSGLSMMYSEAFEIATRDLDAAAKHGWPVAGPEAYPMVLRINPGAAVRSPLVWELELLEVCLRTIPAFLAESSGSLSKTVTMATGTLNVRVSWASETKE